MPAGVSAEFPDARRGVPRMTHANAAAIVEQCLFPAISITTRFASSSQVVVSPDSRR